MVWCCFSDFCCLQWECCIFQKIQWKLVQIHQYKTTTLNQYKACILSYFSDLFLFLPLEFWKLHPPPCAPISEPVAVFVFHSSWVQFSRLWRKSIAHSGCYIYNICFITTCPFRQIKYIYILKNKTLARMTFLYLSPKEKVLFFCKWKSYMYMCILVNL